MKLSTPAPFACVVLDPALTTNSNVNHRLNGQVLISDSDSDGSLSLDGANVISSAQNIQNGGLATPLKDQTSQEFLNTWFLQNLNMAQALSAITLR